MAHLSSLCESSPRALNAGFRRSAAALRVAVARIPSSCPICMARTSCGCLCLVCAQMATASMHDGRPRCSLCAIGVKPPDTLCVDCRIAPPAFERIVAAFDYAPPGNVLIRQWKVNLRYTHVRLLADLLARAIQAAQLSLPATTILTAVPSSTLSIRHRGFNPSAELALQLSRDLSLSLRLGLLRRELQGDKQAGLSHSERASNVMGLYRCTRPLQGQTVLVADDVLTTGATLDAIARVLKMAGAGRVVGVVPARTPSTSI